MSYKNEESLKLQIVRYQQRIFSLVLYLIGGDKDKAYDIVVSSFVEAIQLISFFGKEDVFLIKLAGIAVKKSRTIKAVPLLNESNFREFPSEQRETLHVVRLALAKLPFDVKVLLLLRDQLNLGYRSIAAVMGISKKSAKTQTAQARIQLREKVEGALNRER